MDEHEAQRRKEEGKQLLEALGDAPITYGFACMLPGVDGTPLSELDRLWYDRFQAVDREWLVVVNGRDQHERLDSLDTTLEGGTALVVTDGVVLATLTPVGVTWHRDPDSGGDPGADVAYWDDHVLAALHNRLVERGKDLPDLSTLVSNDT